MTSIIFFMTYIEWLRIAQKENADVPSANYAFRRRDRVRQNALRELVSVLILNATAKIKALNLAESSLPSIVKKFI